MMKKLFFMALMTAGLAGCNRSPEFYFARANLLLGSGKEGAALENYNKALMLKRNFPEALTARGLLYERQGDRQKAGLDYRKAIEGAPDYLPAYNNLAAMLMDGENYAEADRLLTTALKANPGYAYAMLNRGLSRYRLGNCAGASADLSRAVALNPKFELAYYHRALCARKAGNLPAAIADLDAVLALNPGAALAWLERGKALYAMADYTASAAELLKAAELKPADPAFAYWRALALFKTGDLPAALAAGERAAQLKPDSHQAEGLLGDLYAAGGDVVRARAHYALAAELSPQYAASYRARLAAVTRPAASSGKKRNDPRAKRN
jgi:tetratricopeptide (TPR) repeat protein